MEKNKLQFRGGGLLVIGIWLSVMTPILLSTAIQKVNVSSNGQAITNTEYLFFKLLGIFLEIILLSVGCTLATGKWSFQKNLKIFAFAGIMLMGVKVLAMYLTDLISAETIRIVVVLVIMLIEAGICFYALGIAKGEKLLNKWYLIVIMYIGITISYCTSTVVNIWLENSDFVDTTTKLITVRSVATLIQAVIDLICFLICVYKVKDNEIQNKKSSAIHYVCTVVGMVLTVLFFILENNNINTSANEAETQISNVEQAINVICNYIESGDNNFDNAEYLEAFENYMDAYALTYAWQGYIGEEDKKSLSYNMVKDDIMVLLLGILSDDNCKEELQGMINATIGNESNDFWVEAYMEYLKTSGEEDLDNLNYYCLQNGFRERRYLLPTDFSSEELSELSTYFDDILSELEDKRIVYPYYLLFTAETSEDRVNAVKAACGLAEEYPDNMYFLSEAMKFMTSNKEYMNWDIIEKYIEYIKEYISNVSDLDEKENLIKKNKFTIFSLYMAHNARGKALDFYDEFYPDYRDISIDTLKLYVLFNDNKYDDALKLAEEIELEDPENITILTYCAIANISVDLNKSIKYAIKLADIVRKGGKASVEADTYLEIYVEYIVGYYTSPSNIVPYSEYYRNATDEDKALLNSDDLLAVYVNSLSNNNSCEESIAKLTNLIDKYKNLPTAYHFRGSEYYESNELSSARSDLEKSAEISGENVNVYIELLSLYEDTKDYVSYAKTVSKVDELVEKYDFNPTYNSVGMSTYLEIFKGNAEHYIKDIREGVVIE